MPRFQLKRETIAGYAALAPVIPVVTVDDPDRAVALARTLVEAGLPVVEITLRTSSALRCIEAVAREVPEAVLAAGTVIRPKQIEEAADAGARFLVSPGTSPRMAEALAEAALPAMPACATVSEALHLFELGFDLLKFFPAGSSGGAAWLRAVAAPVPEVRFCPTGGLDGTSAPDYLACPNVACVGGSWMIPKDALASGDWARIGTLAREAAALRR
ncbi:bifunctional 4-hydroxy-2-oxoglutarate aldolase/2-dehydro-3-deoxy-phosphogluconate aldolase [Enterovirga aerilata]|uniref:2-dehydro-3-deoxy-phosphogluconate aldolase n=1 Tax=Enterovirga aerilata TaxID=2730920 RepID=A0A849I140_9HYPH|nr:bifunctional 4-hydroxy-2-oxoglutarate aldolase/2-dehydro-3-deoxy-phosphogluconate aldolase [Enterovirga sp. DB1703]NNM73072.1 bifunctional 4-hydroxy-2-oxoglutarate aldolase/2-dehydro-3-deoxy-phosphogluconate aldolase [Enterovirga sp. DB1703]